MLCDKSLQNIVSKQQPFYHSPQFCGSGISVWFDKMVLLLPMALTEVTWWYWLTDRLVWSSRMASLCGPGTLAGRLHLDGTLSTPAHGFSSMVRVVRFCHGDLGLQAASLFRPGPQTGTAKLSPNSIGQSSPKPTEVKKRGDSTL